MNDIDIRPLLAPSVFATSDEASVGADAVMALAVPDGTRFFPVLFGVDAGGPLVGNRDLPTRLRVSEVEAAMPLIAEKGLGWSASLHWTGEGFDAGASAWAEIAVEAAELVALATEASWPRPCVADMAARWLGGPWPEGEERVVPGTSIVVQAPVLDAKLPTALVSWSAPRYDAYVMLDGEGDWRAAVRRALSLAPDGIADQVRAQHRCVGIAEPVLWDTRIAKMKADVCVAPADQA